MRSKAFETAISSAITIRVHCRPRRSLFFQPPSAPDSSKSRKTSSSCFTSQTSNRIPGEVRWFFSFFFSFFANVATSTWSNLLRDREMPSFRFFPSCSLSTDYLIPLKGFGYPFSDILFYTFLSSNRRAESIKWLNTKRSFNFLLDPCQFINS